MDRELGYSATRLLGYSVIQQRKDSSRDVLCRVWAGSFACPASETLELGGVVEEAADGAIEPLDGELDLRNMDRRAGPLERHGVGRLMVGRRGGQWDENRRDAPGE